MERGSVLAHYVELAWNAPACPSILRALFLMLAVAARVRVARTHGVRGDIFRRELSVSSRYEFEDSL